MCLVNLRMFSSVVLPHCSRCAILLSIMLRYGTRTRSDKVMDHSDIPSDLSSFIIFPLVAWRLSSRSLHSTAQTCKLLEGLCSSLRSSNSFHKQRVERILHRELDTREENWRHIYKAISLTLSGFARAEREKEELGPNARLFSSDALTCPSSMKLLLEDPRSDLAMRLRTTLVGACKRGCAAVVTLLLDDPRMVLGGHRRPLQNEALSVACACGHTEVVSALLSHSRVDLSLCSDIIVSKCYSVPHPSIVKLLLSDGRLSPAIGQVRATHPGTWVLASAHRTMCASLS